MKQYSRIRYGHHGELLLEMATKSGPDYVSLAKDWAKNSKYTLESIEENNKKLTFKSNYVSFYVYTPDNDMEGWVSNLVSATVSIAMFNSECMEQY